ncbi:hypothetical protein [Streptomyces roseochromogenus]|uniref:Uncharacterized protein n=1 Tax=Streptomyces roseochromogenus subsp. oscitans DS 12.976 TaxID=1352936 RepID=V6KK89_STRRC|nr:hypothetical protein [Streptomyces roseochromogenus]EST29394.1 hypothetical protein M878_20635 [Streptomyces roseochromogenus subsp. oscitans DS 12.976]
MDSTGDPMDARQARDALAAACAAQVAARKASERHRPHGYAIGQGLTFAVGFIALGTADRVPRWGIWLMAAAVVSLTGFFVLMWLGAHHGGVTRWIRRDREPGRPAWHAWVVPFIPLAISIPAAIAYGTTGWLIAFGLTHGADYILRATWQAGTA